MIRARFYNPLLQPDEKVLLVTDKHWLKRLPMHYVICIGIILINVMIYVWLSSNSWWNIVDTILLCIWGSSITASYFLAWDLISARQGLVLTTRRLLYFSHSILTRSHLAIPYKSIEESDIKENFFSRIFGYGDWNLVVHENKESISFKDYNHIRSIEHISSNYIPSANEV